MCDPTTTTSQPWTAEAYQAEFGQINWRDELDQEEERTYADDLLAYVDEFVEWSLFSGEGIE